jgi:signal transduction histidine kinase
MASEALLANAPVAMWIYDPETHHIVWASARGIALWGHDSLASIQARKLNPGMSPAVQQRFDDMYARIQAGETLQMRWTFYPPGLKPVECETWNNGTPLPDGRLGIFTVASPIEPDLEARRGLEAFRRTHVPMSIFDADGALLLANPAAHIAYGPEVLRDFSQRFVEPLRLPPPRERIATGADFSDVLEVRHRGGIRWHHVVVHDTLDPITGQAGRIVTEVRADAQKRAEQSLLALSRDLERQVEVRTRELEQAREVLAAQHAQLRAVLDALPVMVLVIDQGAWWVNAFARRVVLGAASRATSPPGADHTEATAHVVAAALGTKAIEVRFDPAAVRGERLFQGADGQSRRVVWRVVPLASKEESWIVAGTDLTAEFELHRQTAARERARSLAELAAGLGHDLNNPLAFALANMEHLVDIFDEEKLPESLRSVVTDALDGVQRAARIGQSLAALVSSVGQPTSSVARPLSLVEAAERERARTQTRWARGAPRGLVVEWDAPAPEGRVLVQATQEHLDRAIAALMRHVAERVTRPAAGHRAGTRIGLEVRAEAGRWVLRIRHDGEPLDPSMMSSLFEPYALPRDPSGSGLDLAVAHALAGAVGGRLSATLEGAETTRFELSLERVD